MFGAALSGPLAAPAPSWAKRFSGDGAAPGCCASAPGWAPAAEGASAGAAPGCAAAPVAEGTGHGTQGSSHRLKSCANDVLGDAATIAEIHNMVNSRID